jgi:membrane-bound metal-dependent hydrolase YbcI (DUF457 family)
MDSLTHLVLGHAVGVFATGSTPAAQTGAYWGAFVGNSLPDIDVPVGYLLGRGWGLHRKFTHTIPGVLGLSLAAAAVITAAVPGSQFGLTFLWTLAGCIIHVLLDCHNLFGTRPLWPLSHRPLGWGVLFIIDPFILMTLGLGDLFHLGGWISAATLRALGLVNVLYLAARWAAWALLRRRLGGGEVVRFTLAPWFLFWRYLRETGDSLEYGQVRLLTGKITPIESVAPANGPVVDASRRDPQVEKFLRHAHYPFAQVDLIGDRYRVVWQDLYSRLRGWKGGVEVWLDQGQPAD